MSLIFTYGFLIGFPNVKETLGFPVIGCSTPGYSPSFRGRLLRYLGGIWKTFLLSFHACSIQRIRAFDEHSGFQGIQNSDLVIQIAPIYLVFLLIQWPNAGV